MPRVISQLTKEILCEFTIVLKDNVLKPHLLVYPSANSENCYYAQHWARAHDNDVEGLLERFNETITLFIGSNLENGEHPFGHLEDEVTTKRGDRT